MSTHTPGPWTIRGDRHIVSANGRHIASVIPGIEIESEEQDEADAQLIAVAPEMYDELEIGTGYADDVVATWERGDLARAVNVLRLWAANARLVLAKAEGRTP